jgi:hypothetical protein
MMIDNSGSVGIGTASPAQEVDISSTNPAIRLTDTTTSGLYHELVSFGDDLRFSADVGDVEADTNIEFFIDNSEKMRIDSAGNVYIPTGNLRVTNLVITTKQIDLTTSLQDLIQVGNRASYKITVSVGDGSGGGVSGFNTAYVTCSNDTATQGNITQRVGGTVVLSWKAANGTSADAHTLQARVTSGSANQCTIMVETLSRYASSGSGTGNGQSSIQL